MSNVQERSANDERPGNASRAAPGYSDFGLVITEESLGYATLCVFDRVFPPHPDPLPSAFAARQSAAPARRRQGEGTAGGGWFFSRWLLRKLRHRSDRATVDDSPSPLGRGPG